IEKPPNDCKGDCCEHSCTDWIQLAKTWIDEVTQRTGRRPVVYTVESFFNQCLCGTTRFHEHSLWLAGWPKFDMPERIHFGGWTTGTVYQHAGHVRAGSAAVALDVFAGSREELLRALH